MSGMHFDRTGSVALAAFAAFTAVTPVVAQKAEKPEKAQKTDMIKVEIAGFKVEMPKAIAKVMTDELKPRLESLAEAGKFYGLKTAGMQLIILPSGSAEAKAVFPTKDLSKDPFCFDISFDGKTVIVTQRGDGRTPPLSDAAESSAIFHVGDFATGWSKLVPGATLGSQLLVKQALLVNAEQNRAQKGKASPNAPTALQSKILTNAVMQVKAALDAGSTVQQLFEDLLKVTKDEQLRGNPGMTGLASVFIAALSNKNNGPKIVKVLEKLQGRTVGAKDITENDVKLLLDKKFEEEISIAVSGKKMSGGLKVVYGLVEDYVNVMAPQIAAQQSTTAVASADNSPGAPKVDPKVVPPPAEPAPDAKNEINNDAKKKEANQ